MLNPDDVVSELEERSVVLAALAREMLSRGAKVFETSARVGLMLDRPGAGVRVWYEAPLCGVCGRRGPHEDEEVPHERVPMRG